MARYFFLLFLVLFGLVGHGFAAEPEKNTQIDSLTSFQLGDYTLKFEGESPRKPNSLDNPPGLKSFEKDHFNSFLGLKFSTPLKGDLFRLGVER
jgi:hypothetical protein